jgi:hypothetical protein
MKQLHEIINDKRLGIDCIEEESAEIKMTLKEIMYFFPIEFGEACNEYSFDEMYDYYNKEESSSPSMEKEFSAMQGGTDGG